MPSSPSVWPFCALVTAEQNSEVCTSCESRTHKCKLCWAHKIGLTAVRAASAHPLSSSWPLGWPKCSPNYTSLAAYLGAAAQRGRDGDTSSPLQPGLQSSAPHRAPSAQFKLGLDVPAQPEIVFRCNKDRLWADVGPDRAAGQKPCPDRAAAGQKPCPVPPSPAQGPGQQQDQGGRRELCQCMVLCSSILCRWAWQSCCSPRHQFSCRRASPGAGSSICTSSSTHRGSFIHLDLQ